ncbi:uncharacterized protein A1O5_12125 [Cladophialophora psammophila CBS 110553]|uniref:Uncharacterized protein n=1 Tax=Cladophialophora psammophila CBS 110553 TaxID=1182543 RepID=W9W3C5_9EURO|nr:uncharacterized protein A1O5_12125 [Cladophialophora psammophila CBS 110553]EXJ59500.1 hypothetical protein A1O5_12125 [Cladophialophora psammophila CBS 110553]
MELERADCCSPSKEDDKKLDREAERKKTAKSKPKRSATMPRMEYQPGMYKNRASARNPASEGFRHAFLSLKRPTPSGSLISTSLDRKRDFLLRYFSTTHLAQVYWSDVHAADHNSHIVPLALQKPALFNAMMAKALTDFRFGDDALSDDMVLRCNDNEIRSVKIDFAFFKVQALKHLRSSLDDGAMREICPSIVMTTIFLVKTELVEGNVKEVRLHLRALRELFQNGVSLEFLSPCARSPSLLTINLACSVCQEPPILVPASCANTAMSDEFTKAMNDCPIATLSNLAQGFSNPAIMKLLGPHILSYIPWQKNLILMKEMSMSGRLKRTTIEDYAIATSMVHRADYHLLSLPYLTDLSPVQDVVRVVLLIADMSTFLGRFRGTASATSLALQLKGTLEAMNLPNMEYFEHGAVCLVFWACFYGLDLSRSAGDRLWFMSHLKRCLKVLRLSEPADIFKLLVSFMYTERQYSGISEIVWKDLTGPGQHETDRSLGSDTEKEERKLQTL